MYKTVEKEKRKSKKQDQNFMRFSTKNIHNTEIDIFHKETQERRKNKKYSL
jgi:hypothetical protein